MRFHPFISQKGGDVPLSPPPVPQTKPEEVRPGSNMCFYEIQLLVAPLGEADVLTKNKREF